MNKQITKIIETFKETYVKNPKNRTAIGHIACYTSAKQKDGTFKHWPIGRYLLPKYQGRTWKYNGDGIRYILRKEKISTIDKFLLPEYNGISLDFWKDIQQLHDNHTLWTDEGLTEDGKHALKKIEETNYSNEKSKPLVEERKNVSDYVTLFKKHTSLDK